MTPEVINYSYPGSGTNHDPYLVDWIPGDPRNPYNLPTGTKWGITMIMAFGALAVSLSSTAFAGTIPQVQQDFDVSSQLAVASISLFVLGFAIGPMTWAPISETYGRQVLYGVMFTLVTAFGAAAIASPNIGTLLVMRFFAGAFGASSIANSAAVIFDIFVAKERGLAMMMYTSAPFLGPTLGPICGGFLGQYAGWKWVDAFTAIFTGVMLILGVLFVPETYTPHLLNRRARKLSKMTGKIYKSKLEAGQPEKTVAEVLKIAITRPWAILFFEPIVLSITIYSSIGRHPHWIELPSCIDSIDTYSLWNSLSHLHGMSYRLSRRAALVTRNGRSLLSRCHGWSDRGHVILRLPRGPVSQQNRQGRVQADARGAS
jgi:MFS family permease